MEEKVRQHRAQETLEAARSLEPDLFTEVAEILSALLRGWFTMLVCLITFTLGASVLWWVAPTQYSASSLVEFVGSEGNGMGSGARTTGLDAGYIDSQVELLRSNALSRRVARETLSRFEPGQLQIGLIPNVIDSVQGLARSDGVADLVAGIGFAGALGSTAGKHVPEAEAIGRRQELIRAATTVTRIRQTHIAEVTVRTRDPGLSANLANHIARGFIETRRERKRGEQTRSADRQADQLDDLSQRIADAEAELQARREAAGARSNMAAIETARARTESYMKLYDELLAEHFATLQRASDPEVGARIVEEAVPPTRADAPSLKINVAAGIVLGFGIGSLIVLLRHRMAQRRPPYDA